MGKVKWENVKVRGENIYILSYADDMVLVAENKDKMRSMLGRLEEYLGKKELEINVSKTKIV